MTDAGLSGGWAGRQLRSLQLNNNMLKLLPKEVRGLGRLLRLHLQCNHLQQPPLALATMTQLCDVDLTVNSIVAIPPWSTIIVSSPPPTLNPNPAAFLPSPPPLQPQPAPRRRRCD